MKTSKRLFVLAVILCVATAMTAQDLRDRSCSKIIGRIFGNSITDVASGRTIAQFQGERVVQLSTGKTLHRITSDGKVIDESKGYSVGQIESNGRITKNGDKVGRIENGNVYDKNENRIGMYSGVSLQQAAYFYFFLPKISAPANSGEKKEAVPSTPKADRISIYDRDRRSMGQLVNSERFVSSTKDGPTYEFKKTNEGLTITRNGEYLAHVGKDGKTVYTKHGERVYGIVDKDGNAFLESGEQYGIINKDGQVFATKTLDMPFGIITAQKYDRQIVGLIYFVCYYGILHNYYKELKKKEADK